jgi:hypothetical protein
MGTFGMVVVIMLDVAAAYYLVMSCMRLYFRDTSSVADAALTVADILNHAILIILARATISLDEQPVLIVWPLVASTIFCIQMAMGTRGQTLRDALRAKLRARGGSSGLQSAPDNH